MQDLNQLCVDKFREVFGTSDSPSDGFSIPIVPTLGNNDILPHNILPAAPNRWTRSFLSIWRPFVPEAQRHTFESGGWFTVEVIPNRLVVFSVNSLYFYASNAAVDGCIDRGEPGYKQFEWLRVQLQLVRDRGMKAILTGHVPPARTREKATWDEGCWQKYALWVQRYRDVLVGSVWGHMNIDHFMLQDSDEVDLEILEEGSAASVRAAMEGDAGTESTADYLAELREIWAELPKMVGRPSLDGDAREVEEAKTGGKHRKGGKDEKEKKSKKDKYHDKIGGPFGERFSVSLVSPSVVPNYYPTLRVIEYNVSGIDSTVAHPSAPSTASTEDGTWLQHLTELLYSIRPAASKKKRKHFTAPKGPSKSTPPGPAYSPQPLTWTKYTQLYANLTAIGHSRSQQSPPHPPAPVSQAANSVSDQTRRTAAAAPANFSFVVEYDTQRDPVYRMPDLTVRSWLELAGRIGRAEEAVALDSEQGGYGGEREAADERYGDDEEEKGKGGKKGKKKKKKKGKKGKTLPNTAWRVFLDRAFVGSKSAEELEGRFGRGVGS